MILNKYFVFFSNCLVFDGSNRSIIIDIQRQFYTTIPDSMSSVINEFKLKKTIGEIINLYGEDNQNIIHEYIDFLIKNDFGFFCDSDEYDLFIELNLDFNIPALISNCIIEISELTLSNFKKIIQNLDDLLCKNLQIISYNDLSVEILKQILIQANNSNFRSLELILKFSEEINEFLNDIDKHNFRVTEITFHSSLGRKVNYEKTSFKITNIDFAINSFINCGNIRKKYFINVNKHRVLESLNHNSCLHKKISINKDGYIRNCPSMPQNFGNIKDTTLSDALNHPDFKKYWNVTKDMIEVCKDCEFRHICTDCRAYTEQTHFEGDIDLSKPLKCGYNPYTNEWAEWSTNPLKQKAIEYYGMQELVKKDA